MSRGASGAGRGAGDCGDEPRLLRSTRAQERVGTALSERGFADEARGTRRIASGNHRAKYAGRLKRHRVVISRSSSRYSRDVKIVATCTKLVLSVALLFGITGLSTADEKRYEVEINDTPTLDDDYFCWTPIPARIRMVGGETPATVLVSNRVQENGGTVVFQAHDGVRPTSASFSPAESIKLRLTATGDWKPFWIAGDRASMNGKDTEVIVTIIDNEIEVAAIPVMVRVRKDASKLTSEEIRRFLSALRTLHDIDRRGLASQYVKYVDAHARAFSNGIHGGGEPDYLPLFLAWHRAFLLSLERELQKIDRSVTLPYWRFDRDDPIDGRPVIFSSDFMGTVGGSIRTPGNLVVEFSSDNPLYDWRDINGAQLVRRRDGASALVPAGRLSSLLESVDERGVLVNDTYREINAVLEGRYHDTVHTRIGGWLMSRDSPKDPLFFLLHANVDRAWAQWQDRSPAVRFNADATQAYHAQGSYLESMRDPSRLTKGSYVQDLMWPWGGVSGDQENSDLKDDWPALEFEMPVGPGSRRRGKSAHSRKYDRLSRQTR